MRSLTIAAVVALVALGASLLRTFLPPPFAPGSLVGKRVLLTGASMGIGEALAYEYAAEGAQLVIVARSTDLLEAVAARARERTPGAVVHVFSADLAGEESARASVDFATGALGGLDVLVLNHILASESWGRWSGADGRAAADGGKAGPRILRELFAVNFHSYANLALAAMPALEASGGSVVVVSSAAGKMGMPFVAPYSASKHALHGFFDSLRHEMVLRESGVAITIAVLGNIATEGNAAGTNGELNPELKRWPVDECACAIVRAGAARVREAYYPAHELIPLQLVRPWMPDTLDAIVRQLVIV
jgi:short-subunit dehydrogenase